MNLSTIINHLNNTLGVIGKILPIYEEAKPYISNGKNLFDKFNNLVNKTSNSNIKKQNLENTNNNSKKNVDNNNLPTFFN